MGAIILFILQRIRISALRYLGVLPAVVRYAVLHPVKAEVLRELAAALDDPRRGVRREAVDARFVVVVSSLCSAQLIRSCREVWCVTVASSCCCSHGDDNLPGSNTADNLRAVYERKKGIACTCRCTYVRYPARCRICTA
jgi:hypothetical protein